MTAPPSSSLEAKLRRLIAAEGPISLAEYMHLCLSDPEGGYYATRDPFGPAGDFITAPETSQMFGEIVGAWLIDTWQKLGSPDACDLVELGPGRGTLMADVLRVAELVPEFCNAVRIHLVETSTRMRAAQSRTLAGVAGGVELSWHNGYPAGDRPVLIVANEFFDALPVRQYVRHAGRWHERRVGLAGDALAFVLSPPLPGTAHGPAAVAGGALIAGIASGADPATGADAAARQDAARQDAAGADAAARPDAAPEGTIVEVSPAAEALMATTAADIVRRRGALLLVDYGEEGPRPFGTLQAVRGHARADPLTAPGTADLTAHVDFARLTAIARANGAAVHGPLPQGEFLLRLGLLERAGQLGAGRSPEEQAAIERAVTRLAGPDQMGHLFKVMAVTSQNLVPEPFGR